MSWRDIVSAWLATKTPQEDRLILDLIRCLVEANIIPEILVDNSMLQSILFTQIMLETLNGLSVPKAPQGNTYLPRERQRNDDVGSWRKKCQTNQNVGRTNRSEFGPLL